MGLFLKEAEREGKLQTLTEQRKVPIYINGRLWKTYKADFSFSACVEHRVLVEVKGYPNDRYNETVKAVLLHYPSAHFIEVKKGQPYHVTCPKARLKRTPVTWGEVFSGQID